MSEFNEMTFGVPEVKLPADFLADVSRQFTDLGFVKKAAYVLLGNNQELSYLIYIDLDVPPEKLQQAISLVVQSLRFNSQVEYKGKYSLDFGLWDNPIIKPILEQAPELLFFSPGN